MRLLLLLACLPLFAQQPDTQLFARQAIAAEIRQFAELGEFTFQFDSTARRFSRSGKLASEETQSGETYMSHRRNVDIPLNRNGMPLKPTDLEKRRKSGMASLEADAKIRQAKNYKETPLENRPGPGFRRNKLAMSGVDVLRYCRLQALTWVHLKFDTCKSPWPGQAHYAQIKGELTLDPETRVIQTWRAYSPKGGLVYEYTTQPAPGGARVLAGIHLNLHAAPELFDEPIELIYRWSNPQRFSVAVEQSIAPPQ